MIVSILRIVSTRAATLRHPGVSSVDEPAPAAGGRATSGRASCDGFTLIELVIVVAIVGILASAVLPLAHWTAKRTREVELQRALREVRSAIDAYHDAAGGGDDEGQASRTESGYPPDLEALLVGLELKQRDDEAGEIEPRRQRFLRRIPVDPMTGEARWGLRCYEDDPDTRSWCGKDVWDVYSLSDGTAIDGTKYREW